MKGVFRHENDGSKESHARGSKSHEAQRKETDRGFYPPLFWSFGYWGGERKETDPTPRGMPRERRGGFGGPPGPKLSNEGGLRPPVPHVPFVVCVLLRGPLGPFEIHATGLLWPTPPPSRSGHKEGTPREDGAPRGRVGSKKKWRATPPGREEQGGEREMKTQGGKTKDTPPESPM